MDFIMQMQPWFGEEEKKAICEYMDENGFITEFKRTEKFEQMDAISLGPNLYDVHTPNEHMSISSVKRTWEYLLEVLKNVK